MTDKERLGKIKALLEKRNQHIDEEGQINYHEYDQIIYELNDFGHIDWLIKRVEELEKEKEEWKDTTQSYYMTAQSYYMTNQELREQNKRYKQALKEIAVYCDTAPFNCIAKQALEGDK